MARITTLGVLRTAAYVLVVIMGVVGFARLEAGQERDQREQLDRCLNAEANRKAILDVVQEIKELGRDLVTADAGSPPTPEQLAALERFRSFKRDLKTRLDVPVCDAQGRPIVPSRPAGFAT